MKLTNTQSMKRKAGMTLIELTVVILVLLSLIAILFVGANAWKKGSDRAACIMNIRNVQQAVRGHQNMANKTTTDDLTKTDIVGTGGYLETDPSCPSAGTYSWVAKYPAVGTPAVTCSKSGDLQHAPSSTTGW
ncbi:MAG: type II secretion system protein [Verrucomicrobia bacterium]|nr:type II secretion system protein [Verrucomicrobiota bacterium]